MAENSRSGSARSSSHSGRSESARSSHSRRSQSGSTHLTEIEYTYEQLSKYTDNFESDARLLGDGFTSVVYKGYTEGQTMAVKAYNTEVIARKQWESEKEALQKLQVLQHNNIVKYLGYANTAQGLFIVLEHVPGTAANFEELDNWEKILKIMKGTALGIQKIHQVELVHGDIKLENILVDKEHNPKICDFGNTGSEDEWIELSTPAYQPPEITGGRGKRKKSMDIYSFGIVLLRLRRKDKDESAETLVKDINPTNPSGRSKKKDKKQDKGKGETKRALRAWVDNHKAQLIIDLAIGCTETHPSRRPTIDEVVQNFQNI